MRNRGIILLSLVLIFSVVLNAGGNDKKLFFEVQGAIMLPSDSDFKDIYSSSVIYPRVKAAYKFGDHIYAFFGCGLFNITGETPVLNEESKSKQKICQMAAGYEGDLSDKLQFRVEAGGANFDYEEEAFGEIVEGTKFGIYLGSSLVYNFSDTFFASFNLGYMGASDKINDVSIKLGGIHTGFGIGFRL